MDTNNLYNVVTTAAAWAAVVGTFVAVWLQNRSAKRLTSLQLFMQLAAQYDSVDMQKTRALLASKLLSEPSTLEINDSLLVFYENIAILHRQNLLDSELMINTFSIDIRSYSGALQHYIEHMRTIFNDPRFFIELEQLNDYFVTDAQLHASSSTVGLTDEAIQHFLRCESFRCNV